MKNEQAALNGIQVIEISKPECNFAILSLSGKSLVGRGRNGEWMPLKLIDRRHIQETVLSSEISTDEYEKTETLKIENEENENCD